MSLITSSDAVVIGGLIIPSSSPPFLAGVAVHVAAGVVCVVAGAAAMLSRKGRGRHSRCGTLYFWSLLVVFVTAVGLSLVRWAQDYPLFLLATASFGAAGLGRAAMRRRWSPRAHIAGMGVSYIALLTAFYVDNGKSLPLWKALAPIAYWLAPSAIGGPILLLALWRHPLARRPAL